MMGIITPLGQGRRNRVWVRAAAIYTAGGALSSALVGFCVWRLGGPIREHVGSLMAWRIFAIVAVLLALRDFKLLRFTLPQRKCQAPQSWLWEYDFKSSLFMWGFYIGVGLSSFIAFSGLYATIVALLFVRTRMVAIAIMVSYWLGRILPVWLAPLNVEPFLLGRVTSQSTELFRAMSAVSLGWCAVVGLVLAG